MTLLIYELDPAYFHPALGLAQEANLVKKSKIRSFN